MPTTVHYDPAFTASAFQSRTDDAGSDITDVDGPEIRLPWSAYTEGVIGADSYLVTADGADMSVDVGSGTAFTDLAVVAGDTASLGKYGLLLEPASTTLTVPAADLSNPRIDEVYLVVVDDPGTLVKARLGYRQGDAASSPSAPGPDAGWEGSLLLATVDVGVGVTTIGQGDITDERVMATPIVPAAEVDGHIVEFNESLTGSYKDIAALTLDIPAGWGSWKCTVWASWTALADGVYHAVIRVDGSDQQVSENAEANSAVNGKVAHVTGLTTTGARSISFRAILNTGAVTVVDVDLYARAVRTS